MTRDGVIYFVFDNRGSGRTFDRLKVAMDYYRIWVEGEANCHDGALVAVHFKNGRAEVLKYKYHGYCIETAFERSRGRK